MRIKQGTFSTLPDLTDDEIKKQIQYCLENGWSVSVEFTDDPIPATSTRRGECRCSTPRTRRRASPRSRLAGRRTPNHYIKVTGYNARYTKQTIGLLYGQRPKVEPGFRLDRTETNDRHIH